MTANRKYLETHPWITFSADLRKASPKFWFMLGECQAKCEHIAHAPLPPAHLHRISRIYRAKGALSSAAIAGCTLTEEEVYRRLEERSPVPPSRRQAFRVVENIAGGCGRALADRAGGKGVELTPEGIRDLNRIVLEGLATGKDTPAGGYRAEDPSPEDRSGAPAEDCAHLVERLCEWLDGPGFTGGGERRVADAVIRATLAHLYLAGIQPFAEGNGRTARLLEYHILVSAGVPAISAHLPAIHYNLTRAEYSRQLELAWKSGEVVPFIQYAVRGFLDGLRRQADRTREHQWDIAWKYQVLALFQDSVAESDLRRRNLALDLSSRTEPVPLSGIPLISPRLARYYAKRVERTLIRDLNFLKETGLVEKSGEGYRTRKEIAAGFGEDREAGPESAEGEPPA
jgi:Fic family protein